MRRADSGRIALGVIGDRGRLGAKVCTAAHERGWSIVVRRNTSGTLIDAEPDVLLECARPELTNDSIDLATRYRCPLILATSGRNAAQEAMVRVASQRIAVVIARNLTRGSTLQRELAGVLAKRSGTAERVVIDRHPVTKLDSPSATARALAEAGDADRIEVLRHGAPVAEHVLAVTWAGEAIEVVHKVLTLDAAVQGAMELIQHIRTQHVPGLYEYMRPDLIKIQE